MRSSGVLGLGEMVMTDGVDGVSAMVGLLDACDSTYGYSESNTDLPKEHRWPSHGHVNRIDGLAMSFEGLPCPPVASASRGAVVLFANARAWRAARLYWTTPTSRASPRSLLSGMGAVLILTVITLPSHASRSGEGGVKGR